MTKIKLTAILAATVFIAGSIATVTLVSAAPPENNPGKPFDAILQKLDEIIATLTGTDIEVTNIEKKLDDPNTGLAAIKTAVDGISTGGIPASTQTQIDNIESDVGMIKTTVGGIDTEVTNIEAKLDNPNFGLEEIKKEVQAIEAKLDDPRTGLEEIKDEIQQIALDLQDKKRFYEKSDTGIIDITKTTITGATPGNIEIRLTCPVTIAPDQCAFNVLSFRVVAAGLTGPQTMHFARSITIDGTVTDFGFPARVEIDASDQESNVLVESEPLRGVHLAASDEIGIRYVIGTFQTVVSGTLTVTVVGQMPQAAEVEVIVPDVILR